MTTLYYISGKQLYKFQNNQETTLNCQAINQYTKNLQSIKERKAWKTEGSGAMFTGMTDDSTDDFNAIYPTAIALMSDDMLAYSARLQEGTAIQSWQTNAIAEGLILRKNNFQVFDMAYDATHRRIIASASDSRYVSPFGERHLCVLPLDGGRTQFITEGECQDKNPSIDPTNPTVIYYDSCGLAFNKDSTVFSPRQINRLNLTTGELDTLLSDNKYDYFLPQMDKQGNLYVIRRPYHEYTSTNPLDVLKNLLLSPFKILKAIVGWLDYFTKRYAGESLKTSGANPARSQAKSEEELFIEGNLIKADRHFAKNQADGDKYAGFIPKSWELLKIHDGQTTTIKKGVMAYCLTDDGVIVSNGKSLIKIHDGQEELITHAPKVAKLMWCGLFASPTT